MWPKALSGACLFFSLSLSSPCNTSPGEVLGLGAVIRALLAWGGRLSVPLFQGMHKCNQKPCTCGFL